MMPPDVRALFLVLYNPTKSKICLWHLNCSKKNTIHIFIETKRCLTSSTFGNNLTFFFQMNKKEDCVRKFSTEAHKTPTKWAAQSYLSGSVRGAALLLPLSPAPLRHAETWLHPPEPLSTSHLAHTCHSWHDALVVAFPRNLPEEKVDLVVIWIVGVRNGMSRYKPGL